MPSALVKNTNVEFICARDFTYDGVDYKIGQEFDQDVAVGRIELLVRTRRIIPVVESTDVKPRMFHREVRLKAHVLDRLGVAERDPKQSETEAVLETPAVEEQESAFDGPEEFDPKDHTVDEVIGYVENNPDEVLSVYEMEEQGKNRTTLLKQLDDIINKEDIDV